MHPANRLSKISMVASIMLALGTSMSFGQSAENDAAKRKAAAELAEAVAACDKGASAPFDFTAKAPPVQLSRLYPSDFDMAKLKALQAHCQRAWAGAPKEKRLHLQWLRVTIMLNQAGTQWLAPQLRKLAEEGSIEALYLIHELHRLAPHGPDGSSMITAEEARSALVKAADQGHMAALVDLTMAYYAGNGFKRDLKKAVLYGRRLESAPPQGNSPGDDEDVTRQGMPLFIAKVTLEEDGFSATENRAAFKVAEAAMKANGEDAYEAYEAARIVVGALRAGRGVRKDPVRARSILEERSRNDLRAAAVLADMLARGEGGPEDGERALRIVRSEELKHNDFAKTVEADILTEGKVIGYRPQQAIKVLAGSYAVENQIRLAALLLDYGTKLDDPNRLIGGLSDRAKQGNREAAMALVRLKLSDNSQFSDEDGARVLLKPLADAGDRTAMWLYASTQYRNLGSTSYRPTRRDDGMTDAELKSLIDDGVRREEPEAFLLKAKLLRAGLLYPQDDRAASDMLKQAARADNIEALLLLGDAYDDGLGIRKDMKLRLEAWRRAAELGSLKAKSKISRAFTFDSFDRLMTLEEGVTWRIALYNNGYGRSFSGMGLGAADLGAQMDLDVFSGRAMEAGTDAVAEAIMNGFRQAPAGLDDANLVTMGKVFPQEIKVAIEARLAKEGFYRGSPEGYWGPDARKALAGWVEAKGFGPATTEVASEEEDKEQVAQQPGELISKDKIGRIWDKIRAEFQAAKSDKQKRAALAKINMLAQYGNVDARWALLPNYHQAAMVRRVVSAAEITRYGLDLMITKPPGAEKIEFEFIFNTTQIYQDGKVREFGQSVIAAIRDDVRLQDPLVLGGILKQFIFAPGACDAVLASAKRAGVEGLGEDGCDESSLSALVAFAKEKGPAGIDERNKKAAEGGLKEL
jgi:TPR repeat protein